MIIILLLMPTCNAMKVDINNVATHKEIETIINGALGGFPFYHKSPPELELQRACNLLQHRQKTFDLANESDCVGLTTEVPFVKNNIELWFKLQDKVVLSTMAYQRLEKEGSEQSKGRSSYEKMNMHKEFDAIFNKLKPLYNLAKKGLALELLRCIQKDNDALRMYTRKQIVKLIAHSSLDELDYGPNRLIVLETIHSNLENRQNARLLNRAKDEQNRERELAAKDDTNLWELLFYMLAKMPNIVECASADSASQEYILHLYDSIRKGLSPDELTLYEAVKKGLLVERARNNFGGEFVRTPAFSDDLSDTTKTSEYLYSFGVPSNYLKARNHRMVDLAKMELQFS